MSVINTITLKDKETDQSVLYDIGTKTDFIKYKNENFNSYLLALDEERELYKNHPNTKINSEEGSHGLRYYNNNFQYYDTVNQKWITIASNIEIHIKDVIGASIFYDRENRKVLLNWTDPGDNIDYQIDSSGAGAVEWIGTLICRQKNIAPMSNEEGEIIIDNKILNNYSNISYEDDVENLESGIYYYRFFPYTEDDNGNKIYTAGTALSIVI